MASGSVASLEARILELEARLNATVDRLGDQVGVNASVQDTMWVIITATLIVFMQLGFAMLEAGSVRSHNAIATYAKNILDFIHGVIVAIGFSFWVAYRVHPLTISPGEDFYGVHYRSFFHYVTFQATTATIVSGAMAERVRLSAYLIICTLVSGVIFPICLRCAWVDGFLSGLTPPYHDFAGSGVVHMVGGFCGLFGCLIIGSRRGRWDPEMAADFAPHNVMSVLSGVMILWVGWYGFNCGSTAAMSELAHADVAAKVALNTTIAGAASAATAIGLTSLMGRNGKVDVLALADGVLAGLVGITGACDAVSSFSAFVIGVVAALFFIGAQATLTRFKIDDVVAAFPVHGACGMWGILAVGLFHQESGLLTQGSAALLGSQLIGIGFIILLSSSIVILLIILRYFNMLRISADEEEVGMDSMFGLNAYESHADFVARYHIVFELLNQADAQPGRLVDALGSLHQNIFRPFTPFAGDHRLRGEVMDVLEHLNYGDENAIVGGKKKHLLFLSHYKATGGEAVRIFIDHARKILLESPYGADPQRAASIKAFAQQELIYLDSVNLKDLSGLLSEVGASLNLVLFLTRNCLSRPWVLAELCKAFASNVNIVVVKVDTSPDKAFKFPVDVDKAISDWQWFVRSKARGLNPRLMHVPASVMRAVTRRRSRHDPTPGSTGDGDIIDAASSAAHTKTRRASDNIKRWFKEGEWNTTLDSFLGRRPAGGAQKSATTSNSDVLDQTGTCDGNACRQGRI